MKINTGNKVYYYHNGNNTRYPHKLPNKSYPAIVVSIQKNGFLTIDVFSADEKIILFRAHTLPHKSYKLVGQTKTGIAYWDITPAE